MFVTRRAVVVACAFVAIASSASASRPVPKTIAGCVFNGTFVSSDGYDIRPKNAGGQPIDLRPFEGHAVTLKGNLLPGDILIVDSPPRDGGPCTTMRPAGK